VYVNGVGVCVCVCVCGGDPMIELFASPPSMTYDSRAYFSLFGIGDGDETRNNVVKKVGELGFTW
jgi:hypothetical protein